MKKKKIIILVGAILLITIVLVVLHLSHDKVNAGNAVSLSYGDKQMTVPLAELNEEEFTGTLINGKGDEMENIYRGIELRALLAEKRFDLSAVQYAEATAQDQYSAKILIDEINEPGKVYIATAMDGEALPGLKSDSEGAQLIVFGDSNCKRCVRYLEHITLYDDAN
jgi:hypothetical protein